MHKIKYRSDIDGLRAVAVLSVILFHINSSWIPGGFLGVDIFFVISGYLITLLLAKDISKTHKFHLLKFYERRIKRIIPALLFVLVFTFLVGMLILAPSDLLSLLKSIIWALFSAANIFFYSSIDTGYFATESTELPLLHLWSLGVEEQFYILWPFAVLLLIKYVDSTKKQVLIASILIVISLFWAQSIQATNHSFAYYMLPTRAWELLAGSMVALTIYKGFSLKKIYSEILAIIGILLIILGLLFITERAPIPGVGVLPTILGTVLVILSNVSYMTYVGRILSIRIMVLIGLISYSAYLWHWPILAFLRYGLIEVDLTIGLMVLLASLLMATISYLLIERPLRKKEQSRKTVLIGYFFLPVIVITLTSLIMIKAIENKDSWIYPWEKLINVHSSTLPAYRYKYNCQYSKFYTQAYKQERCVYPLGNQPSVFLIGDSNAAHYLGMIRVFADYYGFTVRNATQSSCPLIFDGEYSWISSEFQDSCSIYRHSVKEQTLEYDTVIIGGWWNEYDNIEFKEQFQKTVDDLVKYTKKIIILGKVPLMPGYSKDCAVRSIRMPWIECSTKFNNRQNQVNINEYIKQLSDQYSNVYYFDIRNQICKGEECSPYLQNNPLYYDSKHLSMIGSKLIGESMLENNDPMLDIFENITQEKDRIRLENFVDYKKLYMKNVSKTTVKLLENDGT